MNLFLHFNKILYFFLTLKLSIEKFTCWYSY